MATKFKLVETGVDAAYNITVNGYYLDSVTKARLSEDKVFNFDPAVVSIAGMQDAVSAAQPLPDPELEARILAANTALAKLATYVGTEVTLDAPVIVE